MINKIMQYIEDPLFLLILAILWFSNDSLVFGVNDNSIYLIVHCFALCLIFMVLVLKQVLKKSINKKILLSFILFSVLLLISCGIDGGNSWYKYFYQILVMGIATLVVSCYDCRMILSKFLKSMFFLACASWIPYLLNIFFPSIIQYFPIIKNSANWRFYNLFIGVAPCNELYHSIYRNYSIFREPGVFAVFLVLALLILLFYSDKTDEYYEKNKVNKIIILSVTLVSTLSTGGIVCYLLVLLFYFISKKISREKIILFTLFVFSIFYLLNFTNIPNRLFSKIYIENNPSTMSRINSVTTNLIIFWDNPILGSGWGKIDGIFQIKSHELLGSSLKFGENSYHNTNTLLRILSTHGILFFSIYLIGYLKFFKYITPKNIQSMILAIICAIMMSNENLTLNCFIYIMIFLGIKYKLEDCYENSRN